MDDDAKRIMAAMKPLVEYEGTPEFKALEATIERAAKGETKPFDVMNAFAAAMNAGRPRE